MKTIFCAFALLAISAGSLAADEQSEKRIAELKAENKELSSEIKEWEDDIRWQRRLRGKVDSSFGDMIRYNRNVLQANERLIDDLRAGKTVITAPPPTRAFFDAPPPIIVTNAPTITVKAATVAPAPKTNTPPTDWRTPEQKAKWDAIKTGPATKIGPPGPATKVIFPEQ